MFLGTSKETGGMKWVNYDWYEGYVIQYLYWFNPNLEGGGVILPSPPPSWFFLNNSKTVKAVTLEFCSIQ